VQKRFSFTIKDLDSANGTSVNDEEIKERVLRRNDLIIIGTTHLLFDAEPDLENVLYGDAIVALGVSHEETLRAHRVLPDTISSDESGRVGVELIAHLGETLAAEVESLPDLLNRVITCMVSMFRGQRGAIFLWDAVDERLAPAVVVSGNKTMSVDHTLLMRVFAERQAMLAVDVVPDVTALGIASGTESSLIGSVICAPLLRGSSAEGVLLVDHTERDRFSLRDVRLLQAVGRMIIGPIEAARLRERLGIMRATAENTPMIIGHSKSLLKLMSQINQAAQHDITVLIEGETGVGKELVAREIHRLSKRENGAFVPVNCSAIPPELFENEFFGHERGAFTGAHKLQRGRVELANGGSLFLDEIGELSLEHQPKFLRFLQDHTIYRVGGSKSIRINTRIIAATHANLEQMVEQKQFRQDLLFRLNIMRLRVPPLRERKEDIQVLADHFARTYGAEIGKPIDGITDESIIELERYAWPGNVRELQNMIERAVILTENNVLDKKVFLSGFSPHGNNPSQSTAKTDKIKPLAEMEREYILNALEVNNNNQIETALALGIHRNTLRNKLKDMN